jgi:RHS repeat-associated protein
MRSTNKNFQGATALDVPVRIGIGTAIALVLAVFLPVTAGAVAHGEASGSGVVGEATAGVDVLSVGVEAGSGAATLSIPVDLPPGPNGQKPNLSFSYSSHRSNGMLGVGWDVILPKISCSIRFGVPRYAGCERFELDGQVLVGPDDEGAYHTFDESFSLINRFGSGVNTHWRAVSTEGTEMVFGRTPNGRVEAFGGVAEWNVSRIEDVFGNRIELEYVSASSGSEGNSKPSRITYARGHREVLFAYESRPDRSVSFRGGLRRSMTTRLREIQVVVNGQLHQRLILNYETADTTTQSRLISIQRFGSDCDPAAHPFPTSGTCTALPAAEFEYTDSGEITASERWKDTGAPSPATRWYAPPEARFSTGDAFLRGQSTQFADLNGDGFPDIVTDQTGRHDEEQYVDRLSGLTVPGPGASPYVHLSDGVDGWEIPTWNGGGHEPDQATNVPDNDSAIWTDRIRALRFDIPSLRVKQVYSFDPESHPTFNATAVGMETSIALGSCIDPGEPLPAVEFIENGGSIQSGGRQAGGAPPYFDASAFRNAEPGHPVSPTPGYHVPAESEIRLWPHFEMVDLNTDGRADMVMSIHLSGFYLSMDSCSSAQVQDVEDATWIPGATARIVFINTGDIRQGAETFLLDDGRDAEDGNYAESLPLFGIVSFESGDLAYQEIGKGLPKEISTGQLPSACDDFGLAGLRGLAPTFFATSWDFCVVPIDLTPIFQDLNGDGYPDIIVKRPYDPADPRHPDYADGLFYNYRAGATDIPSFEPVHRVGAFESVAWLQDPNAMAGEDRWFRAPAYDPPISHSLVAQFQGDSPGGALAPGLVDQRGNAQIYNIDKGVRFTDLNRDGLTDMLVSPHHVVLNPFAVDGAALVNRGSQSPVTDAKYSAWCTSTALSEIELCPEAARYAPPRRWVDRYATYGTGWGSPAGSVTVIPSQTLVSLADFNGDGWVDMLFSDDPGAQSGVYLHNPGATGSVWVKDDRFTPLATRMYEDQPGGNYDGNSFTLPSGYGVADVNGDGVADMIGSDRTYMAHKHSWVSTPRSAHSDLLKKYKNGQGLVVDLAYTGALQQRDASLEARALAHSIAPLLDLDPENDGLGEPPGPDPIWPSVEDEVSWNPAPVLASRVVSTPNSQSTETTFRYAHPRRCHKHKTSHGYRLVEVTGGDGSRADTFYYQKHGRAGKLAERTIYDESGSPVLHQSEVWDLPDPLTVNGGWADLTGRDIFDVAYIGRLASKSQRSEYGSEGGEALGSGTSTTRSYDDVHGYNFVAEVVSDLPGRGARVVRQPYWIDYTNHLVNRPRRIQTFADQGGDRRLLSDVDLSYRGPDNETTYNKLGRRRELDTERDDPQSSRWIRTYFKYAGNGNLVEERAHLEDSANSESRSKHYCYDGDDGCSVGHGSQSILVGTQDAHGVWTRSEPHRIFSGTARSWSDYEDIPTLRSELDSFGRPRELWLEPADGGTDIRLRETLFMDSSSTAVPYRVEKRFADADAASVIESISVGDGVGGVSLSIVLHAAVSSGAANVTAAATETWSDPNTRVSVVTEPFSCGTISLSGSEGYGGVVTACAGVEDSAKTATTSILDTLGRPVGVETPLGVEEMRYSATELVVIGSGPSTPHDAVLYKNANGALKETVLAAGLPVRIRECNNPGPVASLGNVSCLDADETRLIYEPTGELRERVDPTIANSDGYQSYHVGPFFNQRLRYLRNTLGRVIQVDDPDAGTSHQTYDVFGNLSSSTDARGMEVRNEYDGLNRLTRTEVDDETPTEIWYDESLVNRKHLIDGNLMKQYFYDDLGRVWREIRRVDGLMLKVDVHRDYLDRPVEIRYPTVVGGAVDAIAYDYSGAFLERVCDLGVVGQFDGNCESETASEIISSVEYDLLGRVSKVTLPGGERRFEYDGNSLRRISDGFVSNVPGGGEDIEFSYRLGGQGGAGGGSAYDGLGNLLRVDATIADEAYAMNYAYDARNRIASWSWDSQGSGAATVYDFGYDSRGNMVTHAGVIQNFASHTTAHAIQSRISNGLETHYSYDAAGNLSSRLDSRGGEAHYTFDGRGRLVCVGSTTGRCELLGVTYNGEGERVKESSVNGVRRSFVYAGSDFRLRPNAPAGQEYWIEIYALGERVAYKHVSGGGLRLVGLFPGWEWSPRVNWVLRYGGFALLLVVGLGMLAWVSTSPAPIHSVVTLGMIALATLLPVQARALSLAWHPSARGSAVYRWVMSDMIGSGLVEIDSAGQVLTHTAYKPFGQVAEESGSNGVEGRAYFAGHDRQLMNDLVYLNARWMDPKSGTFMSVDPMIPNGRDPQSYNGFAYARNNPVSLVDPSGMNWRIVWTDAESGKVASQGAWQSGSIRKAAAFAAGVTNGSITPASLRSDIAASGGSVRYGITAAAGTGPAAEESGGDTLIVAGKVPVLSENQQRTLDYINSEISGHENALDDISNQNQALREELNSLDTELNSLSVRIAALADSARHVRSFQEAEALDLRIVFRGLQALGLVLKREGAQKRFDSNASFIFGHNVQLGYLRQDLADFKEILE